MTFLVCLAGGGATLIAEASLSWRDLVSKDVTIQIKPRPNEDTDSIVKQVAEVAARTPGVEFVHALSQRESERILEPWLGQGLNLSQLPIPRIIVVTMALSHRADLRALQVALASSAPQASLDDHQVWVSQLNALAYIGITIAAGILILIVIAMSIAIGFATRGAMAGNQEIIAVLHFVGAADAFIAKQFQVHFTQLGARGATIGGSAAVLCFVLPTLFSYAFNNFANLDHLTGIFYGFALSVYGYGFIIAACLATALLTGMISRFIVLNHIKRIF